MAAPAKGFFPTVCKIVCGGDRLYNRLRLKHQFRNSRQDWAAGTDARCHFARFRAPRSN
jgi:hypothetical protein